MKKLFARLLPLALVLSLLAGMCSCKTSADDAEVSVFYYTYSDTYISGVRASMDKLLAAAGLRHQNYDANGNQTIQTEQVTTALSKGSRLLIVNVVDTGSDDAAQNIVELARAKGVPVVFFNRSVKESIVTGYEKCAFVGTDYEQAGHMQGKMIGEYLTANYDKLDLNGDGKISYALFKGQEGNMEAIARTQYAVADANAILKAAGKPELTFYDSKNAQKYQVDQNGQWSAAAAKDYMSTNLSQYSESNRNMIELVIANNDEMALGAISALQEKGYNKSGGKQIPVFGVDATEAALEAIRNGSMVGTVRQDAAGMATAIVTVAGNLLNGKEKLAGIAESEAVGGWRVNIPYTTVLADADSGTDAR